MRREMPRSAAPNGISGQRLMSFWWGRSAASRPSLSSSFCVELRFSMASDGDEPPVGAGVGVVENGAPAVEEVSATFIAPQPHRSKRPHHLGKGHSSPSTIAASITCPCPERARRPPIGPAKIPTTRNIEPPPKSPARFSGGTGPFRRRGRWACSTPFERNVVDVVAKPAGWRRTALPPAGHSVA